MVGDGELSENKIIIDGPILLISLIVIAVLISSSFLTGYIVGSLGSIDTYITKAEVQELLTESESKITAVQPELSDSVSSQIRTIALDNEPIKGNPNATVTIVEFADFQCPFCQRFFEQTLPELEKDYIDSGKVKLIYKNFPIDSKHPNAAIVHMAAACADDQGKFWEYHDMLFGTQKEWSPLSSNEVKLKIEEYGSAIGLDSSFVSCLNSKKYLDKVYEDYREGRSYGVTGTPTFFIGNNETGYQKLVGAQPFPVFKNIIDKQLK